MCLYVWMYVCEVILNTILYTISLLSTPSFLSFHCANVHTINAHHTTSSPMTDLDPPASLYRLYSFYAHQESLIDCPFTPFNNQWRTWFQEECLWEEGGRVGREQEEEIRSSVSEENNNSESLVFSSGAGKRTKRGVT